LIIDTSRVAPSERFELWVEEASKAYFPMSFERGGGSAFSGRAHNCALGPVDVHRVTAGPSGLLRTRRTIDAADPETFHLGLELYGTSRLEQDGRSCTMRTGTLFGFQSSHPFAIRNETDFAMLIVSFPQSLLRPYTDRVCARTGMQIDHGFATRFVAPFLIDLAARIEDDSLAEGGANLGEPIVDVVRSLFLRQDERATTHPQAGALLPQVTSYIYRHLGDPDLTPARIAAAHFVSVRSLHRLWAPRGVSVSAWIREVRLARCRRDLGDPALAHESIGTIAARWGMRNAAHFSRTYREAYGCSPRDHRPGG
jgi:AraC-like DNA-binding protein